MATTRIEITDAALARWEKTAKQRPMMSSGVVLALLEALRECRHTEQAVRDMMADPNLDAAEKVLLYAAEMALDDNARRGENSAAVRTIAEYAGVPTNEAGAILEALNERLTAPVMTFEKRPVAAGGDD